MFGCGLKKIVYFFFTFKNSRGRLNRADMVFIWSSEAQTPFIFLLCHP